jgi:hypothetical protein
VLVDGIGVTIAGTVNPHGIDIQNASAEIYDPLARSQNEHDPPAQKIASMTGQIWLGSQSELNGIMVDDPNDGPNGGEVQAQNGDLEVSGTADLSLAGFEASGNVEFGALKDGLGTYYTDGNDVFGNAELNVNALGGSMMVNGSFGTDTSGNDYYSLSATGDAPTFDGYSLGSATVSLDSRTGLSVTGSLDIGGLASATVHGSVSSEGREGVLYSFTGAGTVNVLGANINSQLTLANEDQYGDALGGPSASAAVNGSFDNAISFNGTATIEPDGSVCGLQGSASVAGITGTASYCGDSSPSIALSFTDYGFTVWGEATSSNWEVKGSVSPGEINFNPSLAGFSAGVDVSWAFDFDVNSNGGLSFYINGSGTISGSTPFNSASGEATLSGTPNQVTASANLTYKDFLGTHGLGTFAGCADSKGIDITEPDPPFSGSCS